MARGPGLPLRSSPTGASCRSGEEPGTANAGADDAFGRPAFRRAAGYPHRRFKGLRAIVPAELPVRLEEAH